MDKPVVCEDTDHGDVEEFAKQVKDAEENCPISKALNMEISVDYTLNG